MTGYDGWVLLPESAVPAQWAGRAVTVCLVPLFAEEAKQILDGGTAAPALGPEDLALASLLAEGLTTEQIARRLRVGHRTVQRHIARLRDRFGAPSKEALSALLANRGIAAAGRAPQIDAGTNELRVEEAGEKPTPAHLST